MNYNNQGLQNFGQPYSAKLTATGANTFLTDFGCISGPKQMCTPYGLYTLPPVGAQVYAMPIQDKDVILGIPMVNTVLKPGEIYLRGATTSYIHFKEDGTVAIKGTKVTINGKTM